MGAPGFPVEHSLCPSFTYGLCTFWAPPDLELVVNKEGMIPAF